MSSPYSIYPSGNYWIRDQNGVMLEFVHDASRPEQTKSIFYYYD